MAVTFVAAYSYGSAGATTGAIAFSNPAPTRGDLLVAVLSWKSTFSLTTTGWTLIDNPAANADGDGFATYYKVSDGTESSVSFAISGSTDQASGSLIFVRGQHPTSPINAHALTNDMTNTATRTAPTVTPTVGYCLGIYGANWNGAGTTAGFSITSSKTMAASGAVEFLCSGTAYEQLGAGTSAVSGRTLTYSTSSGTDTTPGSQAAILIAPAATVSQQPATRRAGFIPRRRGTATRPVPKTIQTQALPPQQPAAVRHGWLPRRRARGTNFVPAQVVVVTTQKLPPQTARDRLAPQPRRRGFTTTPVSAVSLTIPATTARRRVFLPVRRGRSTLPPVQVTLTVPQSSSRRRFPVLRAKARTAQPPVTVTVTVPQQPAAVRHGWLPRAKRRTAQPPFAATATVTTQALPPQQPTVVRHGWLPRHRARGTNYIPAQVVVVTTQALPPQTVRDRLAPQPRRRAFTARPLPVTVTVTTQALPPQTGRDRLTPQPRRKAFTTGLLPTVRVTVPTVTARRRVFLPARRGHAASPPLTVTVTPPPATPTRRRLLPIPRRARTGQFVPQPVAVVTIQVLPPQPVAHARRGWLKRRRSQTGIPPVTTGLASIRLEYLGVPTLSWQADAPTVSWRAASPDTSWAAGEPETDYQAGEPETTWTTAPPTMREPT